MTRTIFAAILIAALPTLGCEPSKAEASATDKDKAKAPETKPMPNLPIFVRSFSFVERNLVTR